MCVPGGAAGRGGGVRAGGARPWCETGWVSPRCSCAGNQSQALTGEDLRTTACGRKKGKFGIKYVGVCTCCHKMAAHYNPAES